MTSKGPIGIPWSSYIRLLAATLSVTNREDNDVIIELLRQASENARAYMDLRFKHFTEFMIVTSLLGVAVFHISVSAAETLSGLRNYIFGAGVALTLLFWLLDYRTYQHHKDERNRILYYEKLLKNPTVPTTSGRILLKASMCTNLIFGMFFIFWCASFWIL